MGISSSPAQLAAKMFAAGAVVRTANTVGTEKAALAFKLAVQAAAPSRLRGVGKSGRALGVRYNGGKYADGAKYLVFATGPWQLIERDTKAHTIPRQRSQRRQRVAVIPGVGPRSVIHHPGTKGKHPWEKTEERMVPLIPTIIEGAVAGALGTIF